MTKLTPLMHVRVCRYSPIVGEDYDGFTQCSADDQRGFPLVRLSDAQAAIAAAEERGMMEERERCAQIALDVASKTPWEQRKRTAKTIYAAITKEPTP